MRKRDINQKPIRKLSDAEAELLKPNLKINNLTLTSSDVYQLDEPKLEDAYLLENSNATILKSGDMHV